MNKKPYTPTRTCPHRWCKALHMVPVPFVLMIIAFDLWHNLWMLLSYGICIAAGIWLPKMIHYRRRQRPPAESLQVAVQNVVQDLRESPSALDLEMEDAKYEGTGWRMLEVRKGWARVAVGCDVFLVFTVGLSATSVVSSPSQEAARVSALRPDGSMLVVLLIGIALFAFNLYAHKKATQPRKPKKVWMPAFMRTNV